MSNEPARMALKAHNGPGGPNSRKPPIETAAELPKPAPASATDAVDPLPPILDRERVEVFRQQLLKDYQPVGPLELAMVRDLARRMAAMERWGEAAEAVERHAFRSLSGFEAALPPGSDAEEARLAAAMATEAVDRVERQALGHSRAFYRALKLLDERQARRKQQQATGGFALPPRFADEAACEAYLARRFRQGERPCPQCGKTKGTYLLERKAWECAACHTQSGLRAGTVMARSPLPLWKWFEAIRWLLWQPTISAENLAQKIHIPRITTVRNIARKIRGAMAEDDASGQLAGLDQFFSRSIPCPEPSGRLLQNSGEMSSPVSEGHLSS